MSDGELYKARTVGMVFDGVEVDLTTHATEPGQETEGRAEKVHIDLKARVQKIAEAYDEGKHPDECTAFMEVDWPRVLGLEEADRDE